MQVVFDDADRAALGAQRFDQRQHGLDPLRIDATCRFVEEEDVSLSGEHTSEGDQLRLPVGECGSGDVGELLHANEPQPFECLLFGRNLCLID